MPIDASIYNNIKNPEIPSPVESIGRAMTLQSMAMQQKQAERGMEQEDRQRVLADRMRKASEFGRTLESISGLSDVERSSAWSGVRSQLIKDSVLNPQEAPEQYDPGFYRMNLLKYRESKEGIDSTLKKAQAIKALRERDVRSNPVMDEYYKTLTEKAKAGLAGKGSGDPVKDEYYKALTEKARRNEQKPTGNPARDEYYRMMAKKLQNDIANPKQSGKGGEDGRDEYYKAMAEKTRKEMASGRADLTEAQRAVDKDYAKHYNNFTQKGAVNAKTAIDRLETLATEMENDTGLMESGGGRFASIMPDFMRSRDAIRRRDQARNFANTTLKELFGGQLSDAEREAAAKEYYIDALNNTDNAKVIRNKVSQLREAYDAEVEKARYFQQNKTLDGFKAPPLDQGGSTSGVRMMGPDGKVRVIPKEMVGEAIAAGGKRVD
jgi:hypothetical protein